MERRNITCLAGDEHNEIAVGDDNGHVTIYGATDWSVKNELTMPMEEKMTILSLEYGKINCSSQGQQPRSVLMVSVFQDLLTSSISYV